MSQARDWIRQLGLAPHPEGGYYRETYRATESIDRTHLPERFGGDRVFSTAIYFLLDGDDYSALHRIKQDELWHFYDGSSLTIHAIDETGEYHQRRLGLDAVAGDEPQVAIRAGWIFGATVNDRDSYVLAGCTVAPGFDFADVDMPSRDDLLRAYPQHRDIIERLTRHAPPR